jgi:hypothetical protein
MSCQSLCYPQYACHLPEIPIHIQRVLNRISKHLIFSDNVSVYSQYFAYPSFPYRITIVNSNGRVLYDNIVPSQYWCLMNNTTGNLEFQIATLGLCKAIIRKEYPNCPLGPEGPGCYPVPTFTNGLTGYIGYTGNTGCPSCNQGPTNVVPYNCMYFGCIDCTTGTGCIGVTGCNESDAVNYLFATELFVCGGQAHWVRIGQAIPYGITGAKYQPCPPLSTTTTTTTLPGLLGLQNSQCNCRH